MTTLIRKRLIPCESIELKNDIISCLDKNKIITHWETFRPKSEFSHGISYYVIDKGFKISKFFKPDNSLAYIYCDIIDTEYNKETDTYTFTDLLADVIIENNGFVKILDLDELADACKDGLISNELLVEALHKLDNLLQCIYSGEFKDYINTLESFETKPQAQI